MQRNRPAHDFGAAAAFAGRVREPWGRQWIRQFTRRGKRRRLMIPADIIATTAQMVEIVVMTASAVIQSLAVNYFRCGRRRRRRGKHGHGQRLVVFNGNVAVAVDVVCDRHRWFFLLLIVLFLLLLLLLFFGFLFGLHTLGRGEGSLEGDGRNAHGRVRSRMRRIPRRLLGQRQQLLSLPLFVRRLLAQFPGGLENEAIEDDEDTERNPIVADNETGVKDGVFEELNHALARP